ncbi:DUF427 domain-containing protein [Streptomyces sp. V4-01]|uniref:DUF427 domain-containing protein n=1 Tax=Actinacidiphila polyblastidii TaxID=3110430 RepID=A0ABU7PNS7_9ACTN|nr:DUF427 domain-containing protein [Streptomyces sp. V4-01]
MSGGRPVESVWDYPRPPAVRPCGDLVTVEFAGMMVAETRHAVRVLETSHPPVFYLPPVAVAPGLLRPSDRRSWCEWKGEAVYWHLTAGGRVAADAAWSYPDPSPGFEDIRDHLAFYPSRVDRCVVAGEEVTSQEGDFYGGWITSAIEGPFKGPPGTSGW